MLRRGGRTSRFYLAILQSGTRRALRGCPPTNTGSEEQGLKEDNAPTLAFASLIRRSGCTVCAIADGDLDMD